MRGSHALLGIADSVSGTPDQGAGTVGPICDSLDLTGDNLGALRGIGGAFGALRPRSVISAAKLRDGNS